MCCRVGSNRGHSRSARHDHRETHSESGGMRRTPNASRTRGRSGSGEAFVVRIAALWLGSVGEVTVTRCARGIRPLVHVLDTAADEVITLAIISASNHAYHSRAESLLVAEMAGGPCPAGPGVVNTRPARGGRQ